MATQTRECRHGLWLAATHLSCLPGSCSWIRQRSAARISSSFFRMSLCRPELQSWATAWFKFCGGDAFAALRSGWHPAWGMFRKKGGRPHVPTGPDPSPRARPCCTALLGCLKHEALPNRGRVCAPPGDGPCTLPQVSRTQRHSSTLGMCQRADRAPIQVPAAHLVVPSEASNQLGDLANHIEVMQQVLQVLIELPWAHIHLVCEWKGRSA